MKIRIATRKSPLAVVQTQWVATQLQALEPQLEVELVEMLTQGDRRQDVSLATIGGKGLFVSELERAVLDGRADLAVHSMKDLPAELAEGLTISCVPEREDPRDVLVTADGAELDDLTAGTRVGTNSARRTLQMRARRGDLEYAMLRGSVNTRLSKLEAGEYGAIVLASAGLRRLELDRRPLWVMPVEVSLPAVGQGALAIESRSDAADINALLTRIEHAPTRTCVEAERAFLHALGGDCHTPLAGHAQLADDGHRLRFEGLVGSLHDARIVRGASERLTQESGPALLELARELGAEVGRSLLAQGADVLIAEAAEAATGKLDPRTRPMH
ncbi:MAG: hydroxymethylbilane synthase [Myxococcales bacterium]|nr:hydroxymethylbilane synthase [Myxococcales bacterium]